MKKHSYINKKGEVRNVENKIYLFSGEKLKKKQSFILSYSSHLFKKVESKRFEKMKEN